VKECNRTRIKDLIFKTSTTQVWNQYWNFRQIEDYRFQKTYKLPSTWAPTSWSGLLLVV